MNLNQFIKLPPPSRDSPPTRTTTPPNCLLRSSLSTSCVSSTSPHFPVCHLNSTLHASTASSIPNLFPPFWRSPSKPCPHSATSLAPIKRLFPARVARSRPANVQGESVNIQLLIMAWVSGGWSVGRIECWDSIGVRDIAGQRFVVRNVRIGWAVRFWRVRREGGAAAFSLELLLL